ncbi:hypothetical protein SAY86_023367 [Trapa natans]|uniref:Xyloglucan endo-transglycosylase C-terminal domain-containing protein n=1 Tax=Trapa natans TaxID=22666 RepID=A0AAN7R7T0_TRANT|nr:hypothetical protein SAY86_023367 [Trapa natans]
MPLARVCKMARSDPTPRRQTANMGWGGGGVLGFRSTVDSPSKPVTPPPCPPVSRLAAATVSGSVAVKVCFGATFVFPCSVMMLPLYRKMGSLTLLVAVLLMVLGGSVMAAPPRRPVAVPFGRNYVPTWAFDHIKYYNGGSQIELYLDKYTGTGKKWWDQKEFQDLDSFQYRRLQWVRQKYTVYNYCTDRSRYPTMPPECTRDKDV